MGCTCVCTPGCLPGAAGLCMHECAHVCYIHVPVYMRACALVRVSPEAHRETRIQLQVEDPREHSRGSEEEGAGRQAASEGHCLQQTTVVDN